MASPNCPRCKSISFEINEISPLKGIYKVLLINCTACGCVVGSMPFLNTAVLIEEVQKNIKKLQQTSEAVFNNLENVEDKINKIIREKL